MIAKKGLINTHHFSHASFSECQTASETILHLLVKELFLEISYFLIPQYLFEKPYKRFKDSPVFRNQVDVNSTVKDGKFFVNSVKVEQWLQNFRPDIVLNDALIVEIAVTSFVLKRKLKKIRNRNLPAVEIRFTKEEALLDRDALKQIVINKLSNKVWLYHPSQRAAEANYYRIERAFGGIKPVQKKSASKKSTYAYSNSSIEEWRNQPHVPASKSSYGW